MKYQAFTMLIIEKYCPGFDEKRNYKIDEVQNN